MLCVSTGSLFLGTQKYYPRLQVAVVRAPRRHSFTSPRPCFLLLALRYLLFIYEAVANAVSISVGFSALAYLMPTTLTCIDYAFTRSRIALWSHIRSQRI